MPEMEWDEWRVGGHVPNSTWKSPDMRRKYMTHLGSKKGFKSPEDWYALSTADFYQNYGSGLLHEYYGGSPLKALQEYLPGYSWLPWRFAYTAKNVFQEKTNRIQAVKWLLEEVLGLMDLEEFYQLRQEHLVEHLNGITPYCGGSPLQLLRECYPDYEWLEWKFGCTPHGFWDKAENRLAYLDWLGKRLGFREPDDWYLLTAEDINRNYGSGLFTYYDGSPAKIVMSNIDNPQGWDQARFSAKLPWRRQRHLYEVILKLFPDKKEWIIYNYHHPDLRFADSGRSMQLDIFIPPDLAIEYQGEPHFFAGRQDMFGGEAGFSSLQIRDEEKRQACKEEGIKLIEITYEWDGSVEQIVEALKNHGVFPTGATPI
jgi:hypothetical protein